MPKLFATVIRKNSIAIQFAILLAFALVLNREGNRVPGGNEQVYLLYLVKAWHANFLASDWTFAEPTAGHPVFNLAFGWPTLFVPLEMLGWVGRLASWAAIFAALSRIGRHYRIPSWLVSAGILLWLIQRQSFVSNEWVIGTFEAKCASYACLLWAIEFILRGRVVVPALLTGLAFTFHSAVGLWGGAAVALAFALQGPPRATLKFAALAALAALPGAVTALKLVLGGHSISPDEARYLVVSEMPFHLDPLTFGTAKIAVLYMMLLFNWLQGQKDRVVTTSGESVVGSAGADPTCSRNQQLFLARFQLISGAFFAMGIVFRVFGKFSLVELFPFRVFAVTVMLFFFWHMAAAYWHRQRTRPGPMIAALGVVTFFCLPSPVARLQGLAADQLPKWRRGDDDFRAAATWVRDHAPPDAVVIAPPWRKDAFYFICRPLVADWHAPRYNAMTEWRQRIEALVGDVSHMDVEDNLAGAMDARARDHYAHLSEADLSAITCRYGGNLLISEGRYGYPPLFTRGSYTVYQLDPPKGGRMPGTASVIP